MRTQEKLKRKTGGKQDYEKNLQELAAFVNSLIVLVFNGLN